MKFPVKTTAKKSENFDKHEKLSKDLKATYMEINQAKFDLVREYVSLAEKENQAEHLDAALGVLSAMNKSFSMESAMAEHVELQSSVAEMYMRLGRTANNRLTLEKAKHAYRAAITLASVTGDEALREELRQNYRITLSLLGDKPQSPSLFKVA
ncbi:MAG: hypothetical protein ABJG88_04970 [Litorimonas sp.]